GVAPGWLPPGAQRVIGKPADEVNHPVAGGQLRVYQERVQVAVQARRLQVPVHEQDPGTAAGQQPGDVRDDHRPAGPTLVGVEREEAPRGAAGAHVLPPGTLIVGIGRAGPPPHGCWISPNRISLCRASAIALINARSNSSRLVMLSCRWDLFSR